MLKFSHADLSRRFAANMRKAVILTVLDLEYNAVREHLANLKEETYLGTIYEKSTFTGIPGTETWEIIIVQIGSMGNSSAAQEGERALSYFKPEILFLVGIAGGLKDVVPGDVIAARKIYYYE